jgi:hypothetical protein
MDKMRPIVNGRRVMPNLSFEGTEKLRFSVPYELPQDFEGEVELPKQSLGSSAVVHSVETKRKK